MVCPAIVSAQETENYTINYAEETITIGEGYSLYAEKTGGTAIFTSTGENNTTSLTSYIQDTDRMLYLQAPTAEGEEQPDRREITIPARPQAPTVTATINYSEEKISFPPNVNTANLEYSTDTNVWQDVPNGATLSEMGWDGSTAKIYYFRTEATDVSFASSATATTITAPARPAAPAAPTTVEVTSNSITIQVVSGQEYRLDSSGTWSTLQGTTGTDGKTVYTYSDLDSGTKYTIETRTPAETTIENKFASFPASITVTTKSDAELGDLTVSGQTGFEGHFQYGDIITVTFTPQPKEVDTKALTENTATLTYTPTEGESIQLAEATEGEGGTFTLTYDTKKKELPIGEDLSLTVSYGGSGEFNPVEETVTLSLDQAYLRNIPTVTGNFVYGETLTVNYTPQDDEEVTYQWYRVGVENNGVGESITGATGPEYKLTLKDIGNQIYVDVIATDVWHYGKRQSTNQDVVAKAFPTAPVENEGYSIDYMNETITVEDGYELSSDKTIIATSPLAVTPGTSAYVRKAETATHTASDWAEVLVPERPNLAVPEVTDKTATSVTITAEAGVQYRLGADGEWESGIDGSLTFDGLNVGTTYTIYARIPANMTAFASEEVFIDVTVEEESTEPEEPDPTPDPDPTPSDPEPTYYRVDLRPMEGATIIPSSRVVEEGGTLTFTIEIEEGYVADSMMVTVSQGIGKAVEVKPDEEGIYIVKSVDGLVTITVYGVKEATPVGMENIEGVQVYSHEGAIYVYTPTEARVMIVAMNGVLKANGEQVGKRRYELPRGFYVVWVEGESFKVAN